MKKYFFIITAFLSVILSSCSNEDIEIINHSGFSLNISTQSVYDDFGITEPFKNLFLGGKGYSIGVYSFIYDEQGGLVASDSTYVDTFQRINLNFQSLRSGNYTLVTLEMIVENADNYSSPNWVIIDKDNLETIKIVNKDYTSYWYSAVGLYTAPITIIPGEDQEKMVDPKGIGVIIGNEITNFDASDYVYVGFFTKDQPQGRLLSPSYKQDERFVYDHYNESNVWTSRGYDYDKKGLSYYVGFDVYLLEEGLIRYCYGALSLKSDGSLDSNFYPCPSTNSTFIVKDGLRYYGGYIYKGGQAGSDCTANLFDTYDAFNNWYENNQVYYSSYVEPYLEWGSTATSVKNYMTNAGLEFADSGINEETETYWTVFRNTAKTVYYEYHFDQNMSNLNTAYMSFDTDYFTISSIKSKLTEIYGEGNYSSELDGYVFGSDKTVLLLSNDISDGFIDVVYIPNTSRGSIFPQAKYFGIKK